ncbi:MAG: DUF3298 and DUF4163 domain-containing protein [Sporomusaceae bacterium]|nr:DUF3298 and DUF4163 domain-containing protein [Sporomusaceae bacterium]
MDRLMRFVLAVLFASLSLLPAGAAAGAAAAAAAAVVATETVRDGVLDMEYPVVSGIDAAAARAINVTLAGHREQFRAAIAADPYVREAVSRFEVQRNSDGILSLTVTDYQFSGGAHGMSVMKGYSFDLASGYLYRFDDLIPPWGRDQVTQAVAQQINDKKIPLLHSFTGLAAEPDFYLQPDRKLVVFYQLYELAPYAWGFVRFPVSY